MKIEISGQQNLLSTVEVIKRRMQIDNASVTNVPIETQSRKSTATQLTAVDAQWTDIELLELSVDSSCFLHVRQFMMSSSSLQPASLLNLRAHLRASNLHP